MIWAPFLSERGTTSIKDLNLAWERPRGEKLGWQNRRRLIASALAWNIGYVALPLSLEPSLSFNLAVWGGLPSSPATKLLEHPAASYCYFLQLAVTNYF